MERRAHGEHLHAQGKPWKIGATSGKEVDEMTNMETVLDIQQRFISTHRVTEDEVAFLIELAKEAAGRADKDAATYAAARN